MSIPAQNLYDSATHYQVLMDEYWLFDEREKEVIRDNGGRSTESELLNFVKAVLHSRAMNVLENHV